MARSLQIIPVASSATTASNSQLQFSPSGKFLYLAGTSAARNWMGVRNAQGGYDSVTPGQFSSIDWNDDETRVLSMSLDGETLQLRSFNPATGVFGAVLASLPIQANVIRHLGGTIFAVVKGTASNGALSIINIAGNALNVAAFRDYATARIWTCDFHENVIYLRCGATTAPRIDKLTVAANGQITTETIANAGNGSRFSVSESGLRFISMSSTNVADMRLGNTTPLSFQSVNWTGKLMSNGAFIFDDTAIMCVTENNQRFFLDAATGERVTGIENPAMRQIFGNFKNFSRFGNQFVWLTDSPFTLIEEINEPEPAIVEAVGIMATPEVFAGVRQNIQAVAEGLMGDAFFSSDSVELVAFAQGIMGNATLNIRNTSAEISAVGIMATPEVIANNNVLINLFALAPMGDAWTFISKPGVCKSPR